jgi:hypothetical protein
MRDSGNSGIDWLHEWDEAIGRARRQRRLLLIDVEKDHWIGCELLDTVVYPDPAVIATVAEAFIALRIDYRDPHMRELNVVWLPTVVIRDHRGHEHARLVNAAPAADFLDLLALGEAHARLKEGRSTSRDRAVEVLAAALARREDGPYHPELLYWHAIAGYFRDDHDDVFRDRVWAELRHRYPDSVWARRVPEFLIQQFQCQEADSRDVAGDTH